MNLSTKHVTRVLNILLKYKKIYPNKDINEITQFYIDRFNDSVRAIEIQVENEVVLHSLEYMKELYKLIKENGGKDLDLSRFTDNCLRLLEDRIERIRPDFFLKTLKAFDDTKHKERYIGTILKAMRENKFDIRRFKFD